MRDESADRELNLRGETVEEALVLLERFLAEATAGRVGRIKVIHGKGMRSPNGFGVVRDAVRRHLEDALEASTIKDFRLGNPGEGGAGVTIIWL
jgi:DNA mismatch repair protein MutS2